MRYFVIFNIKLKGRTEIVHKHLSYCPSVKSWKSGWFLMYLNKFLRVTWVCKQVGVFKFLTNLKLFIYLFEIQILYLRMLFSHYVAAGDFLLSLKDLNSMCSFKHFWIKCLAVGNWQKWKRVFLTCPCHKIYRDEAVGFKSCKYTWKTTKFLKMGNLGQYRENLIFCQ